MQNFFYCHVTNSKFWKGGTEEEKNKKYKKKQSVFRALEEDGRGYGLKSNTAGWEKEMRACVTGWTKEREMALS